MTTIRSSKKVNRLQIEHPELVIIPKLTNEKVFKKCYECGGSVTIKFDKGSKGGYDDSVYMFKCQQCSLQEYDEGTLDIDDEDKDFEGCDSEERCIEAWKLWFREAIEAAQASKSIPDWLVYL